MNIKNYEILHKMQISHCLEKPVPLAALGQQLWIKDSLSVYPMGPQIPLLDPNPHTTAVLASLASVSTQACVRETIQGRERTWSWMIDEGQKRIYAGLRFLRR